MRKIWWIGPLLVLMMLSGWLVPSVAQWIDQQPWPGSVKSVLSGPLPPGLIRQDPPWFWQVGAYPSQFQRRSHGFSVQLDDRRLYVPNTWSVPQGIEVLAGNRLQIALPLPDLSFKLPVSVVPRRSWLVCPQGVKPYARGMLEPVPYRDCPNFWPQYEDGLREVIRSYEEERVALRFEVVKNAEDGVPFMGMCQESGQGSCEIVVENQGLTGTVKLSKALYKSQGVEILAYVHKALEQLLDPQNAP